MLSIIVSTYNQANLISAALNSILMQYDISMSCEVIVADDGSVDNTNEVVSSFRHKFKNKGWDLVYLRAERNVGALQNFISAYRRSRGIFVAMLDGDDYWTDRNKLNKQLNLLLDDDGLVLSCTSYNQVDRHSRLLGCTKVAANVFSVRRIFHINNVSVQPSTVVFRRIDNLVENLPKGKILGFNFFVNRISAKGLFIGLNEITTDYLVLSSGIYSGLNELGRFEFAVATWKAILNDVDTQKKIKYLIHKKHAWEWLKLSSIFILKGRLSLFTNLFDEKYRL